MRATLRFFFPLLVAGMASVGCSRGPDGPSILLVTLDTTRADHLSGYGYDKPTTPHIDRLAAEGVRYTNAYTCAGVCSPSRYSILTGRYPTRDGTQHMRSGISSQGPPGDTRASAVDVAVSR